MGKITFTYAKYYLTFLGQPLYNNDLNLNTLSEFLSDIKNSSSINISTIKGNTHVFDNRCNSLEISLEGEDDALKKTIDNITDKFRFPYTIAKPFMLKLPKFIRKSIAPFETEPSTKDVYNYLKDKVNEKQIHYTSMKYGVLELGYHF